MEGEWGGAVPDGPSADSPEGALASDLGPRPEGRHESSVEGDSWVGFDYRDGGGEFRGWVMVEQADDGWFPRWVVTCQPVPG